MEGKKKTRPPKFDYESPAFYEAIQKFAGQGMTDRDIARALIADFGETITPQRFSMLRNEVTPAGTPTKRAKRLCEALARGRETLNLAVRSTYLKLALGGKKIKSQTRRFLEQPCSCGGSDKRCQQCKGTGKVLVTDVELVQETETELPPSLQAASTWLFNNDPEWKQATIEGKTLDITSKGRALNEPAKVLTVQQAKELWNDLETNL